MSVSGNGAQEEDTSLARHSATGITTSRGRKDRMESAQRTWGK